MQRIARPALAERLAAVFPLDLPGFSYIPAPYGGLGFHSFGDTAAAMFDAFAQRVVNALGNAYFPIYRMADGEFAFLVGERQAAVREGNAAWLAAKAIVRSGRRAVRGGGLRTCWGEEYGRRDVISGRARVADTLAKVAAAGVIAPYFLVRPDSWSREYFEPVSAWLDAHVAVERHNYVPFYAVYALLSGAFRDELFGGRRIVVATHLSNEREVALRRALAGLHVSTVQFIPLSPHRSLFDAVDLSLLSAPVDLALVAGGIGSVNVLAQLAPLGVPAIDCGMFLETLVHPERAWDRPFLVPDARTTPEESRLRRRF